MNFQRNDYVWFCAGVFVLAGFVAIPIVWGMLIGLSYVYTLVPALMSCGIFIYAHNDKGEFNFSRFLIGMGVLFLMALKRSSAGSPPFFIAGGILGFGVLYGCGYLGIMLGKKLEEQDIMLLSNAKKEQYGIVVAVVFALMCFITINMQKNDKRKIRTSDNQRIILPKE